MNVGKVKRGLKSISNIFKTKNVITIKSTVSDFDLLSNKIVLITGGTGGIGKSIAIKMLECGAKVIVCGTNQNKINSLVNKVNNNNFKGMIINLNEIKKFDNKIKEAEKLFGKINVLVNCAGIHSTKNLMDYLSITEDDYTKIMDTNLKGTYFISQSIAKYMISNKIKGHILNISSSTENEPAWSPYRLSKWGIKGLTKGLAQQLIKYGIVVNSIVPGSTSTKLLGVKDGDSIGTMDNEVGRMITPEEIAEYAKLLVSDLGDMIIGETIYISGGRGTIDIR